MGSPVSVVVTELVMNKKLKKKFLTDHPLTYSFGKDILMIVSPLSQELRLMNFIIISTA